MADELEALLQASTRPRKAHPQMRELFGDMDSYPVFLDIAVLCDAVVRDRTLAWPMRFPFPPAPPNPPDFAGLVCVYCNHLARMLSPHLSGAARNEPLPASEVTSLLNFLVLSAHSLSKSLPSGIPATAYLDHVMEKLLESVRIIRPDDEPYWESVASACNKVVRLCGDNQCLDNKQLFDELEQYLSTLAGLERPPQSEALTAAYLHGTRLVERVAREVYIADGDGQPPRQ